MDKFRLMVFGDVWNVYQVAHRDWIEDPAVFYIPTFRPTGLLGPINRLHFNPSINRILPLPFKPCWNGYYLRGITDKNLCFLVTEHWLRMESAIHLLPYLRRRYPHSRIVCFTQDMVETIRDHYTRRPIDLEYLRQYADLLISYDSADAQKHQMLYHPTVFSPIATTTTEVQPIYDLYFLGRDKGRLTHLVNICHEAQLRGLKCCFMMLEVPKEQQIPCEGITYLDSPLSYADNLRMCAQSRCIVEMLQHDAASATFRTWEAIMLNRKLLTTNMSITASEFYEPSYISVFSEEAEINWQFVQTDVSFPDGNNPYQQRIRPQSLVNFIEKHLNIQIEKT